MKKLNNSLIGFNNNTSYFMNKSGNRFVKVNCWLGVALLSFRVLLYAEFKHTLYVIIN